MGLESFWWGKCWRDSSWSESEMDQWLWHEYSMYSVTVATLWGLYQGLTMAWQQGCCWFSVEVDSPSVTQLVSNPVAQANEYTHLLQAIKGLIKQDWHITIWHVYREVNHAIDSLAKYAPFIPFSLQIFPNPLV